MTRHLLSFLQHKSRVPLRCEGEWLKGSHTNDMIETLASGIVPGLHTSKVTVMIIVTGGAGFIGSNIVKALNDKGITDILVVDNLKDGTKFVNLVDLNIADYMDKEDFLIQIMAGEEFGEIEAIFHEGACSSTTEWDGKYMMDNNYQYSKEILHYCLEREIPFLYASSAATYGGRTSDFIESREYEQPLNVYGYSKFLFDEYVRQVLPEANSQIVGFRYFNVYGPREGHKGSMASVAFHLNTQLNNGESPKLFEGSDGFKRDFVYVGDGEIAVIDRNAPLKIVTLDNHDAKIDIKKLQLSISQLEKGGYPHFMLKEIYEQPKTIVDCIRGRISPDTYEVKLSGVIDNRGKFLAARRIVFVACGTSWHAALIGEHLIENICRIPVEVEYASEFRYRNPIINADDIVIAVSQSGETADTLAAVELARKAGAFVFGICNVVGSSIARATDSGAYIHVGPEIGVASTKAFTGQVTVMAMLALAVGREKGTVTEEYYREVAKGLLELPAVLEDVLGLGDRIADLSKIFTYAHNFIYLGRGYNYPTALEGALKLKEISYIHAEGYPAAEMKHGAIALIDNEMPTVAIATPDNTYEKTASNIEEIRARGGKIIAVIARDDTHVRRSADYTIEVPVVTDCLMPIVVSVPLQLLAYYIAVNKGRNVDQPRNLAKSVTVE